jgi:hypothetical protein
MLLMMCTYLLWVGVGTFEREWVWLQIAAEMKHAIADSEPEFVVACVGGNAARLPNTSSRRSSSDRESLRRQYCGIRNSLGGRSGVISLSADGARSAQRTLAGEGINRVQRDVGNVNRLKSA